LLQRTVVAMVAVARLLGSRLSNAEGSLCAAVGGCVGRRLQGSPVTALAGALNERRSAHCIAQTLARRNSRTFTAGFPAGVKMANHRLWLFAAARWLLRAPERPHAAGVAPGAWRDPSPTSPHRLRRQARAPESRQRSDSTWRLCHSSGRRRRGCGAARSSARDEAARRYRWVRAWPAGDAHGAALASLAAHG